jgi:hypothetical protein
LGVVRPYAHAHVPHRPAHTQPVALKTTGRSTVLVATATAGAVFRLRQDPSQDVRGAVPRALPYQHAATHPLRSIRIGRIAFGVHLGELLWVPNELAVGCTWLGARRRAEEHGRDLLHELAAAVPVRLGWAHALAAIAPSCLPLGSAVQRTRVVQCTRVVHVPSVTCLGAWRRTALDPIVAAALCLPTLLRLLGRWVAKPKP